MVKKNYAAWHINPGEFRSGWSDIRKLQFFARYAILAPSGHNTQPWKFTAENQILQLRDNPERHLPYSGTQAAEPYVSLGSCLAAMELAAQGFGYKLSIIYTFRDDLAATITLDGQTPADPSLLQALVHRTSNRNNFDTSNLDPLLIKKITGSVSKNSDVSIISDRSDIAFIANQTKLATIKIMSDPQFRSELSKWVRNNLSRRHDGMPAFAQGMPTPPSLIARHIIKNIDISKGQAKKDAGRIVHSADLALITIRNQSKEAYMDAGRLYAQICILARQHGIATSGIGAAVIDTETKQTIKDHFELESQPLAIIRLGHTKKYARHTPRWPLHKVTG